jgi:hypothetical protein
MKITILQQSVLVALTVSTGAYAQDAYRYAVHIPANPLRRLVMQSDVIVAGSDYSTVNECVNDYSMAQYYVINRIDA